MQFTTILAGLTALAITPVLAQVPVTLRLYNGDNLTGAYAELTNTYTNGGFNSNGLAVGGQVEGPGNGVRSGVVFAPAPASVTVELHTQGIQAGGGPCAGPVVATYNTTINEQDVLNIPAGRGCVQFLPIV